jgi:hypothetical protein
MATWEAIEQDAPEFADRVRALFQSGTNKTMATLRRDGSPRISGTELEFADGLVTLGVMPGSMKLLDVRRDPRVAIHSPTLEPPKNPSEWLGEAKLAGTLVEVRAPQDNPFPGSGHFRVEVTEVALTYVGTPADHLVIESWHPGCGWERRTRT